jgi:beta-N-acetylhexosaminidase
MRLFQRAALLLLWLAGLLAAGVAAVKNDPYLVVMRGAGNVALVLVSVAVIALLWRGRQRRGLIALWCLPPLLMAGAHAAFEWRKREVLQTDAARAHQLGAHFIVGYDSFDEVARLAERGLIGGVYITRHNARGRGVDELRAEIAALQDKRRAAGLPPLMVAADQEGGIVSHLSPPLTRLPALATLAGLPPDERRARAEEFGRVHGRGLAGIGVNLNFAPVLDLKPRQALGRYDFHTRIDARAIDSDPATVAEVASAYVRGLASAGVGATVKHFPGIGGAPADTHHFSARLDTPVAQLAAADWLPFRALLAQPGAHLMVSHVTLAAVDPERPASHSKSVIDGIVRRQWGYQGIVMTDDLGMGAIYRHGLCPAVVEALNAGVDLLLVVWDGGAQFYRVFDCALQGLRDGKLDAAALRASAARLGREHSAPSLQ